MEELIKDGVTFLLALIATIKSFKSGNKKTKTAEEIEAKEEERKQKRIAKQLKKNKIKPIEQENSVAENNKANKEFYEPVFTHLGQIKIPKVEIEEEIERFEETKPYNIIKE